MEPTLDELLISEMDRLYRYAFNHTHDPYLSEDIVQDIVVQCYRSYPRLRDKSRMQAWLWGIARNMVMRSFKGRKELPADEIMIISLAGVSYETPETELIHKEEIAYLRRSLSYLAKNYREVCILYYLEGKDYQTIADTLGIPLSSVKWRLNQSKEQIKKEFTKMEYMNKGYRKAIPLKLDMGGFVTNASLENGNFDSADRVLDNLLAQNICIVAYEQAKTVTEIASELGVSADFIEDTLERLLKVQAISRISDKYRTTFPILSAQAMEDIMGGNRKLAKEKAGEILDGIYALEDEIRKVGFIGSDREMNRLLLILLMTAMGEVEEHSFDTEKLPFHGADDNAWYILATTGEKRAKSYVTAGVDVLWQCGIGTFDAHIINPAVPDTRLSNDAERNAFVQIYKGEIPDNRSALSQLIEKGKVVKDGEEYKIAVPTMNEEQEEALKRILAPVVELANDLQKQLLDRSYKLIKKYLPNHLQGQAEFFRTYFGEGVIETACMDEYVERELPLDRETVSRMIIKKPIYKEVVVTVEVDDEIYETHYETHERDIDTLADKLSDENTEMRVDLQMTTNAEI